MNQFSVAGENVRDESVALARVRRAEMVRAFIESSEYRERFFGSGTGNQQGEPMNGETRIASLPVWMSTIIEVLLRARTV
jgi:hypothetical protein